jgi:tripartite ATP-independent transporter DctP family solute receptor
LIEQAKAGALDLTKASASVLAGVDPRYRVFDIPFLLRDRRHWHRVVTGQIGDSILTSGAGAVFGLTFYDAGARSFYGQRSILRPEDLRGLTIRVQPSPSTLRMVQLLEAEPRIVPWNSVYSALQTGLVDGAENNPTALTLGRHAEVVKYYSLTEHTMVPDVLLVSRRTWDTLPERHRSIMRTAAQESALLQGILWEQAEAESRSTAQRMGITFQEPDRAAFARKLAPLKQEFAASDGLGNLIAVVERA